VKIIEDLITERTVIFLRAADMQTTTENQIRKSVEVELSTDLTEQKLLVRSIVTRFLADPDQFRDVGKKSKADRKRKEAAAAAAAAAAEPVEELKKKEEEEEEEEEAEQGGARRSKMRRRRRR